MRCIEAHGLTKTFSKTVALNSIDIQIDAGRIVGLIGPNGAGKTSLLNAILGLAPYEGELNVLGFNPWHERAQLMEEACFVADVAILPRWLKVSHAIDYMAGVHPRFNRTVAEGFLAKTTIQRRSKVGDLSKGMVAQLHLALAMSIDAKLLVLDEPTLGLDLLYRKQFYESLLNDFYDKDRTIIVATHHIDEIQHILTDAIFIDGGRIVFNHSMEDIENEFSELMVSNDLLDAARALNPLHTRHTFGRHVLLYRGADPEALATLGEVRSPSLSDLFVAFVSNQPSALKGEKQ